MQVCSCSGGHKICTFYKTSGIHKTQALYPIHSQFNSLPFHNRLYDQFLLFMYDQSYELPVSLQFLY